MKRISERPRTVPTGKKRLKMPLNGRKIDTGDSNGMLGSSPLKGRNRRIQPRLHRDFGSHTPFFDEELSLMQSRAHMKAVLFLSGALDCIGEERDLVFLADHPVWYLSLESGKQKVYAPDLCLARTEEPDSITAEELLLALEVVTSTDARKERKDTEFMRSLNEKNGVPEFLLIFPEQTDERVLAWYALEDGVYREIQADAEGWYESRVIPGLRLRPLPPSERRPGIKTEIRLGEESFADYAQTNREKRALQEKCRSLSSGE